MSPAPSSRRPILAWSLYDWANSAFATTVMAGFFPVFFKQYWAEGLSATDSTFWLGVTNTLASLLVLLLAPVLGAVADVGGLKRRMLGAFAVLGIVMTGGLFLVAQGAWFAALALYGLAIVGFSGSLVFYDALLVDVATPERFDRVSALGYALGYLGGGLLFAGNLAMVLHPAWFGLADKAAAVQWSFLSVALWWALFSIPLWLFVRESEPASRPPLLASVRGGVRQVRRTFGQIRRLKNAFLFLLAYWLYIDGVDTVIRMAVDYGLSLGFPSDSLMIALLITQFLGFPAAILFGRIGEWRGPRFGIMLAIGVYFVVILWAYRMQAAWEFYALAALIGSVQGGIQSLSRSYFARLIPASQAGEFFGFYNMLGKFAAVFGPLLMALVIAGTGSHRLSILSVSVLFILGGLILWRVDEEEGVREARRMEAGEA